MAECMRAFDEMTRHAVSPCNDIKCFAFRLRVDHPEALESCIGTAGFSIGEITALTFAGALNFQNGTPL